MSVIDVQDVAWDLDPLVDGEGPEGADRMLAEADERAAAFAERYAGNVAGLDGPGLAAAMAELQAIAELVSRAGNYAHLRFAVDTIDPANGALVALVSEKATAVEKEELRLDRGGRRSTTRAPTSCSAPTASTRAATTSARSVATGRISSPSRRRRS